MPPAPATPFIAWLAQVEAALVQQGAPADGAAADILNALPELSQAYDTRTPLTEVVRALHRIPA